MDWEFNPAQILDCMMQYADVSTGVTNVGIRLMWSRGKKDMVHDSSSRQIFAQTFVGTKCFIEAL